MKQLKHIAIAASAFALTANFAFAQDALPQTLFTNVHVFDGVNEARIENASVLVEGNLIKEVSTDAIDAPDATVTEPLVVFAVPDDSTTAAMYDFVKNRYEAGAPWEIARDDVYRRYQVEQRDGYDMSSRGLYCNGCFASGINFAASIVSLLYGEGDFRETVKVAVLAGWDSDNPEETWATSSSMYMCDTSSDWVNQNTTKSERCDKSGTFTPQDQAELGERDTLYFTTSSMYWRLNNAEVEVRDALMGSFEWRSDRADMTIDWFWSDKYYEDDRHDFIIDDTRDEHYDVVHDGLQHKVAAKQVRVDESPAARKGGHIVAAHSGDQRRRQRPKRRICGCVKCLCQAPELTVIWRSEKLDPPALLSA